MKVKALTVINNQGEFPRLAGTLHDRLVELTTEAENLDNEIIEVAEDMVAIRKLALQAAQSQRDALRKMLGDQLAEETA